MKKKIVSMILVLLLSFGLIISGGCASAQKDASLQGTWELLDTAGMWAAKMVLNANGTANLDDNTGKWNASKGQLTLSLDDGQVFKYSYTLDGYTLSLENKVAGLAYWYINVDNFMQGDSDASVVGKWMDMQDEQSMLNVTQDGKYSLENKDNQYSYDMNYFARDGIMRLVDDAGDYVEYYRYDRSGENVLNLNFRDLNGNTDNYYIPVVDGSSYTGTWKALAHTADGLPTQITLNADGQGTAEGGSNPNFKWEAYSNGVVTMLGTDGSELGIYCDIYGSTMYYSNDANEQAMYVCEDKIAQTPPDTDLSGNWTSDDGTVNMTLQGGHMDITYTYQGATKTLSGDAVLGADIMKVTTPNGVQYFVYQMSDATMYMMLAEKTFEDVNYWVLTKK